MQPGRSGYWVGLVLSTLVGCGDPSVDATDPLDPQACELPAGERYMAITGRSPRALIDGPPLNLCTLVRSESIDSAGLFEVRGLVGRRETAARAGEPDQPDEEAVTYIELALVEDWMRARRCAGVTPSM